MRSLPRRGCITGLAASIVQPLRGRKPWVPLSPRVRCATLGCIVKPLRGKECLATSVPNSIAERVLIKPARFAELPLASEAIKLAHFKFGPGGQRERNWMQDIYG